MGEELEIGGDLLDQGTKDKIAKVADLIKDGERKLLLGGERPMYYDQDGKPMGLLEWGAAMGKMRRTLTRDYTANGYVVSTVWLGLDHNRGDGPPLIFETMIFGRRPKRWAPLDHERGRSVLFSDRMQRVNFSELSLARYATKEEAMAGHLEMLARARAMPAYRDTTTRRREQRKLNRHAKFWREAQRRQDAGLPLIDFGSPTLGPEPTPDDRQA